MVTFVNEQGIPFFECHPAEARTAVEFINDLRQDPNVVPPPPHLKKAAKHALKILDATNIITIENPKGSNTHRLADAYAQIESHNERVAYILCNASTYAHIRKFDRDTIDIEKRASVIQLGIMGSLWGAHIIVSRTVPHEAFLVANENLSLIRKVKPQEETLHAIRKQIADLIHALSLFSEAI